LDTFTAMPHRRLAVVSYFAHQRFEPRGIRTRAVIEALSEEWEVVLAAAPRRQLGHERTTARRVLQGAAYRLHYPVALDRFELMARWDLARWSPVADLALLIGYPFSPVTVAARRLARRGVPYVVDMSDPWALTALKQDGGAIARARARCAEAAVWAGARGAILTSDGQKRALQALFPHLTMLVRPNGYASTLFPLPRPRPGNDRELRLGHFGSLYGPRVELRPFLERLAVSKRWRSIVVEQFGPDRCGALSSLPAGIEVHMRTPRPWAEVLEVAQDLDLAIVVGNRDASQLPSKVVDYLTLPIPRVALVPGPDDNAIADYVADKPGWLVLSPTDPAAAERVAQHQARRWCREELRPPPGESWTAVGREIAGFLALCLQRAHRDVGRH
jgi:hypothetical protein